MGTGHQAGGTARAQDHPMKTNASDPAGQIAVPAHWSPEQALAVLECLQALREAVWARYGPQARQAWRDQLVPIRHRPNLIPTCRSDPATASSNKQMAPHGAICTWSCQTNARSRRHTKTVSSPPNRSGFTPPLTAPESQSERTSSMQTRTSGILCDRSGERTLRMNRSCRTGRSRR